MEFLFGMLVAMITLLVSGQKRKTAGGQVVDTMGYSTKSWAATLAPLCAQQKIPLSFALSSIEEESGGNPCAIGAPGAVGTDGAPKEMGIFQFYNPDDLTELGATSAELRAYCVPTKVQVKDKHGNLVWSHSQSVARQLSDAEVTKQATMTVNKITKARSYAAHYYAAAKAQWPVAGVDFWRLVKLVHGLPGLVQAIVTVATHLGRAPTSWQEYRATIEGGLTLDPGTEAYRSDFARIFANAEAATAAMQATGAVS